MQCGFRARLKIRIRAERASQSLRDNHCRRNLGFPAWISSVRVVVWAMFCCLICKFTFEICFRVVWGFTGAQFHDGASMYADMELFCRGCRSKVKTL